MPTEAIANGEARVSDYLTARGFVVQRFDKAAMRRGRTPDFRVMSNNRLAFFCEVKTAQEDEWLDRQIEEAPPGRIVGGARPEPIYNRISNQIHSAAGQFDSVNPECEYPNLLAIVNSDHQAGKIDLIAVLTGNAYTDSGPVRMFRNYSEGRIREEKLRIHLYLWFDDRNADPFMFFPEVHTEHHAALCRHFSIDPARIRRL
jgi:hypothetical protein